MTDAERAQTIGPLMNKLRAFLLRRTIRNVIGQAEPTFDMAEVMARRRILLMPLPKGIIGEEGSALLGSLVMALLWQTAQGRATLPAQARTPFFCYVDEFQDYLNLPTAFTDVLAQARGFGFGLILAHQYLGQLPAAVRQGLANARTKVVFQTSADDARVLAHEFSPYLAAADLQGLGPLRRLLLPQSGLVQRHPPAAPPFRRHLRRGADRQPGKPHACATAVTELRSRQPSGTGMRDHLRPGRSAESRGSRVPAFVSAFASR